MKISRSTLSRVIAAFLMLGVNQSVFAATWFVFFDAGNSGTQYHFDADTVVRQGDTVTVWIKSVQKRKADDDGSWSTASRWQISCSKRTIQTLAQSIYRKDATFIKSHSPTGTVSQIVPDSIGEEVHKSACTPGFPKVAANARYAKIFDNDVFAAAQRTVEYEDSLTDSAPK